MKKIIHLTDTHIGKKATTDNMEKLVAKIKKLTNGDKNYVIIYTGDVIDDSKNHAPSQYEAAKPYLDGLKANFTVLAVPGNHDYGSGVFHEDEQYVKPFNQYFYGKELVNYPEDSSWIDDGIAFIGLNSMATLQPVKGELGEEQRNKFEQLLKDNKHLKKVVFLHHSPFELHDTRELEDILSKYQIDMLLYGHTHDYENLNGKWGIQRVYNGGEPTSKKETDKHYFRMIDLSSLPPTSAEVDGIAYP